MVSVKRLPVRSIARVRSWVALPELMRVVEAAARQGWPVSVGRASEGESRVLCVGPADWLVTAIDPASAGAVLGGETLISVDLTDALAVIELKGEAARATLSSGCCLDLHPEVYGPGCCARTRLAQVPVVVDCVEPQRFELYVARSYASYLESWLADAALSHAA